MMATYQIFRQNFLLISLILCTINAAISNADEKPSRWSRQISNSGFLNDWIPVQPRQAGGRVLNFGPPFGQPQNGVDAPVFMNQQPPAIPQQGTSLGEPFQRIYLQQMHPPNLPILPQNQQQLHVSNLQSNPFRLHHDMQLTQGPQHFLLQHNQQPELPNQNHFRFPHFNPPAAKPEFIRNGETSLHHAPQQEQLIQNEPPQMKHNGIEHHPPAFEMPQMPQMPPQEEVQLLYVPLDTLYQQQQQHQQHQQQRQQQQQQHQQHPHQQHQHHHQLQQQEKLQNTRYNVLPAPVNPLQINNFYTHQQKFPASTIAPSTAPFKITTSAAKLRTTTSKPVHRFSFNTVTESPKPKSHQPPLAMFMKNSLSFTSEPTVNDVLSNLVFSRQIDVIDSVSGKMPDIFIGPYGLNSPNGYTKFELPYLSSLEQNRSERQISMLPFFVAPLSYRVPKGFAKIPLPSPHVGSVVVNSPNSVDLRDYSDKDFFFGDPKFGQPSSTTTTTTTTPKPYFTYSTAAPERPERHRTATTSRFRFGEVTKQQTYQNEPETVPTTPSTLSSYNAYRPTATYKPQQPESVRIPLINNDPEEQTFHFGNKYHAVNNYATVSPTPKQSIIDDFAKDDGPSKISLTNSQTINNTAPITFKNEEPNTNLFGNYFTQTSTGSYFNTYEPIGTTKQPESAKYEVTNYDDHFSAYNSPTQIPSTSTSPTASSIRDESAYRNDEVEKMKSYFREQEAFKSRQPIAISTPASYYESSTAGTLATEKGFNEFSTIPSKLTYFSKDTKQTSQNIGTTPRTTVTYYTASSSSDSDDNPQTKGHSVHRFRFVDSVHRDENRIHSTSKPEREKNTQSTDSLQYNEIYNTSPRYEPTRAPYGDRQTVASYDENTATYNIPSELSPIGANLPGLVNSLMEKDGTTPLFTVPTTSSPSSVTTRRSNISRGRRPQTTTRSPNDDGSDITTRRPPRGRRPVTYGNRTTTQRPTTIRNSNRVRFNPSADERNNLNSNRPRTRARPGARPSKDDKEEENIDYQRDVLKQNYPIGLNRSKSESEGNKVYYSRETTITPFEQTKSEKDVDSLSSVKDASYYGSKDDSFNRNSPRPNNQESDLSIYASTTTQTSIQNEDNQEEITEVLRTRKPSFIRRVSSTAKPATQKLTQSEYDGSRTKDRNAVRQKNWQESTPSSNRAVKIRARGKRPTTTASPNEGNTDQPSFYKERKQTSESSRTTPEKRKNQFRFSLNAEESQWSTKYNSNSFQPLSLNEKQKSADNLPEVEIVTASPMSESEKEMYSFNVQANFFDFNKNKENESASTAQPANNIANDETNTELSKLNSNTNLIAESSTPSSSVVEKPKLNSFDEPKAEKKGKRRGVWKRVRVRPIDSFEAAESQNLGKQLYNSLYDENRGDSNKDFGERYNKKPFDITSESDSPLSYDEMYDQVQTVLPVQMSETSTEPNEESDLTTLDLEAIESSSESTTEPIEKDERELEATSTYAYKHDDDATTTPTPFLPTENTANESKYIPDNDFESMKEEKAHVTELTRETRDKTEKTTQSSSIMDEVKQKLTELFSFEDDDVVVSTTERVFKINRNFGKRPKSALPLYTSIDRDPLINDISNDEKEMAVKSSPASMKLEPVPVFKTILRPITEPSSANFHKELMDSVIYATSTSTEISHETEICYRGRCVKTQKKP